MSKPIETEPVNILYCESNIDGTIGGSFYSLLYLSSGLNKKKYKPLVAFHCPNSLIPKYNQDGVDTVVLPLPIPLYIKKPQTFFDKLAYLPAIVFQKGYNFLNLFILQGIKYAYFLKKNKIKILHLNNSIIKNHEWMLGAKLAGIKCVTHERGINQEYPSIAHYFSKYLKAIICISDAVKLSLTSNNFDQNNLVTIYNGINPDIVSTDKPSSDIFNLHQIPQDATVIGVVGNIKEWKGQETIIRALPNILKLFPNVVCLLVGDTSAEDMHYKNRLLKLLEELSITDNVKFTGYTDNVANYLSAMEVVIHTSIKPEPFGRVLIEAMSMKKPLIGARAGAVPEIIQEKITGLTFPAGDANKLSEAILSMLGNIEAANLMGEKGYNRLKEHFHITTNIRKTEKLYELILNEKKLNIKSIENS